MNAAPTMKPRASTASVVDTGTVFGGAVGIVLRQATRAVRLEQTRTRTGTRTCAGRRTRGLPPLMAIGAGHRGRAIKGVPCHAQSPIPWAQRLRRLRCEIGTRSVNRANASPPGARHGYEPHDPWRGREGCDAPEE